MRRTRIKVLPLIFAGIPMLLAACDSSNSSNASSSAPNPGPLPGEPVTAQHRSWSTDVLVFTGTGTWSTEIADAEALFAAHGASYQEVNSAELDAMTVDDITKFGVIFIPGGSGGTEAGNTSAATHANLREAVQVRGVSYVGFCAGAFVAVAPTPPPGGDVSYGFGIVNGPVMDVYYLENQGTDIAIQTASFPDGSTHPVLWYGGPVTPNTGVIAKYPTGEPAASEIWSGNGLVIIAGFHPDVTQATLDALGMSPDTPATDLAWKIFSGALHQTPLPAF